MFELQVTPLLSNPDPAVGLQLAQDLSAVHERIIHLPMAPGPLAAPCRPSLLRRRGAGDQRVATACGSAPPQCRDAPVGRLRAPVRNGITRTSRSVRLHSLEDRCDQRKVCRMLFDEVNEN
jgi:hypothetical protein